MNTLIVAPSAKAQNAIADIVSKSGEHSLTFAGSVSAALHELSAHSFDLAIINGDSEGGAKEAAKLAAAKVECGVILLETAQRFEETLSEVAPLGVTVVQKPISKTTLFTAVQTVVASNMRVLGLKEENRDLSQKIEDLKIIDRAKIALIQRLGYTEDEAHKYIEKQAMNLRTTKREIAMNVLKTYEN